MEITLNLNIRKNQNVDELNNIIYNYTGAFYDIFNHIDSIGDEEYIQKCRDKYNLPKSIYGFCCIDAKMTLKSHEEIVEEKNIKIEEIDKKLKEYKEKKEKKGELTKKEKYHVCKLISKLAWLTKTKDKGVCFGSKHTLRQITKLKNILDRSEKQDQRLRVLKADFKRDRKRSIFLWGAANEGGNRHVDFHLNENYIIFKYNKDTHIRLDLVEFKGTKRKNIIKSLQKMIDNKEIPVTVRISSNKVHLTLDNEILNGYGFNTVAYNYDVKTNKDKTKTVKDIKKEHYEYQRQKKVKDKLINRCAGVDMNPMEIGFSIVDLNAETGEVEKIIFHRAYDLRYYVEQKNISTKERNKYKHEVICCYDDIFRLCKHFKVSMFSFEELTKITTKKVEDYGVYFNRITKNIWNRKLQVNIIKSRCDEQGIIYRDIDVQYSSFIGNIKYGLYDCCSAAVEIARRGYNKYGKKFLYPTISDDDCKKMSYLAGYDVIKKDSWVGFYKKLKSKSSDTNEELWRNKDSIVGNYLNTRKSKVVFRY